MLCRTAVTDAWTLTPGAGSSVPPALADRTLPARVPGGVMADLHRAGRYDRMSSDVLTLTGQMPLSVQEFVRKNSAAFSHSISAA